jgi:hypothetical protein
MIKTLFDTRVILEGGTTENELIEWIYKVYQYMIEASGIKDRAITRRNTVIGKMKNDESTLSKSV